MKRLAKASALLLIPLILGGCKEEDYRLIFSHELHVVENEMDCDECHGEISATGFSTLSHETCTDCHDEVEAKKISLKTCGLCHGQQADAAYTNRVTTARPRSRAFVHTEAHAESCQDCHGKLLVKDLKHVPTMKRSERVRLREQLHAQGRDCKECHVDMDPRVAPPSHDRDWQLRHGLRGEQEDAACGVCHTEDSCNDCHSVTQPISHNNLWRLKTHGVHASWDRQRCLVCHEPDSCTSCHEVTRPRSHNAAWSRTHCDRCHTSALTGEGCALCHQDGLIESHPNPHAAGFRSRHCNTCHPGTPESESCYVCHEGGFEAHPSPHSAGWRSRHCDSCHFGSGGANDCALCHDTPAENHGNPHSAGWRSRHCTQCHAGSSAARECAKCHRGGSSVLVHEDFWPPVHNRFGDKADCFLCHNG